MNKIKVRKKTPSHAKSKTHKEKTKYDRKSESEKLQDDLEPIKDSEKWYCCKDCGSDEIMWSAYVDELDEIIDLDFTNTDVWCNVCDLFTEYTSKEKYNEQ